MPSYGAILAELDHWTELGLSARVWWRDDDAVTDTPQLRELLRTMSMVDVVVGLGVIPQRADYSLVGACSVDRCSIWQHGWGHHFWTAGEFGEQRDVVHMIDDALRGQEALDRLFGVKAWQRVFVPPNHMLALPFKSLIPGLGYVGVSAGEPLTRSFSHVAEVNAEVDLMDWPAGHLHTAAEISRQIGWHLERRRTGAVPSDTPLGILTHHLVHDADAWTVIRALAAVLRDHPAVVMEHAHRLFDACAPATETAGLKSTNGSAAVTLVVTSCGRPDLLARTLDSFFAHNTFPIRAAIVMEDGNSVSPLSTDSRYRGLPMAWRCTGRRVGQMAAVDRAYELVDTEYIFHCEDDWEFFAPGFVERSLVILESHPNILQVWLRAPDDTNRHPSLGPFEARGVRYRLMRPGFDAGEWGTWHGFSLNPGLRRRRDMALIGSFATLQRTEGGGSAWKTERAASEIFARHGFLAAIADDMPAGYVRHIGWGRRVGDPD